MNVYESAERYAQELNMTVEQAKIRLEYFSKAKEKMATTKKCPKCGKYSLAVEGGEWECGISDWIYCENDRIEKTDEEGEKYFDECGFTDEVKDKYLFAFDLDFDAVLMWSCSLDIHDDESVRNKIGSSWSEFVAKDTAEMLKS